MIGDKLVRMPGFVATGEYVLVSTGCGDTINAARRAAYSAIRKVHIPNDPMYRLDIGIPKRLREGIPRIQKFGYAVGLQP